MGRGAREDQRRRWHVDGQDHLLHGAVSRAHPPQRVQRRERAVPGYGGRGREDGVGLHALPRVPDVGQLPGAAPFAGADLPREADRHGEVAHRHVPGHGMAAAIGVRRPGHQQHDRRPGDHRDRRHLPQGVDRVRHRDRVHGHEEERDHCHRQPHPPVPRASTRAWASSRRTPASSASRSRRSTPMRTTRWPSWRRRAA